MGRNSGLHLNRFIYILRRLGCCRFHLPSGNANLSDFMHRVVKWGLDIDPTLCELPIAKLLRYTKNYCLCYRTEDYLSSYEACLDLFCGPTDEPVLLSLRYCIQSSLEPDKFSSRYFFGKLVIIYCF